jgi:ParB-like chromosome segregation protein Spo0J
VTYGGDEAAFFVFSLQGVLVMHVQKKAISELKLADYNPESRIEQSKLKSLKESVEKYGMLIPVAIKKNGEVIDGHRRVAVAKEMEWDSVPVLIINTEASTSELYSAVNTTARRMNGNEQLYVWLRKPDAISESQQRWHDKANEELGRDMLIKIARAGFSITMYRWAKEIQSYIGDQRPAFLRKIVNWLLKHRNTRVAHSLIVLKQPPEIILKAIRDDRPIGAKYSVA